MAAPGASVTSCGVLVHRPAAGGGREFLFLRAYRTLDLPKGVLESGESEREGALRELGEETGIGPDDVELAPGFRFETAYPSSWGGRRVMKTLVVFLARLRRADVRIRLTEHHGSLWLPWPADRPLAPRWLDLLDQATRHLDRPAH